MKIYLAEGGSLFQMISKGGECMNIYPVPNTQILDKEGNINPAAVFRNANILQSFYYCDKFTEQVIIPNARDFMLDSGAFTFMQGKNIERVNWDEYIERYADFVNRNKVKKFFELDIDNVVGYEKVKHYRILLERMTGQQCIPVWHSSRGKEEWLKLCDEYEYVAIGGIVSKEVKPGQYPIFTKLIAEAHKREAKVHGLGFTSVSEIKKYHFDSVDSSSWSAGNRFGMLYKFTGKDIIKLKKKDGTRIADHQKLALHNFNGWVKFSRYAEVKL